MDIGVGTFISLANSAWSAYKVFNAAGPSFRDLAADTKALRDHLNTVGELLKICRYKLNSNLKDRVDRCERRCGRGVKKAYALLDEYPSLKSKRHGRFWEKFHAALFRDVESLRTSLQNCVSSLGRAENSITAFLVSESQDRMHSMRRRLSESMPYRHRCFPRDSRIYTIPEEDADRRRQPCKGRSRLHEACAAGDTDRVAYLVRQGSDPTIRTEGSGGNALHIATWYGHLSVMRLLLDDGDNNFRSTSGKSQMMNRASKSKRLLEMEDKDGDTPLHIAVERRDYGAVSLLLNEGATSTINMRNNKRQTPLHRAAANGFADIAQRLLDYGAGTSIKDYEGLTASDLAKKGRHERCLRILDKIEERVPKKAARVVKVKHRVRRKRGWFG